MPPTQYSTSSRSSSTAHNDSDQIDPKSSYGLGNYSFALEIDDTTGGPAMEVTARCTNTKTGKVGTKTKQFNAGTQIEGWYVEVNGTTADVYVIVNSGDSIETNLPKPIASAGGLVVFTQDGKRTNIYQGLNGTVFLGHLVENTYTVTAVNPSGAGQLGWVYTTIYKEKSSTADPLYPVISTYTLYDKSVQYFGFTINGASSPSIENGATPDNHSKWWVIWGEEYNHQEVLIGRFAIDVGEAGGGPEDTLDDPDDEWDEPEDYDPEEDPIDPDDPDYPDPDDPDYPDPIEPGDPDYPYDPDDPEYPDPYQPPYQPPYYPPTKTLYLTITGALSGRHNDPLTDLFIEDGEYKPYIPADKETVKSHGYGGDGGHGGGGGAGASTVVVHRFATSKANSKEITAIARRHGYGSGGGKGGKGGSGCILIYY